MMIMVAAASTGTGIGGLFVGEMVGKGLMGLENSFCVCGLLAAFFCFIFVSEWIHVSRFSSDI